jgi:hypothetical protein
MNPHPPVSPRTAPGNHVKLFRELCESSTTTEASAADIVSQSLPIMSVIVPSTLENANF